MKCKFCGAELEDDVTVCPACGKDNGEEKAPAVEAPEELTEVTPEEIEKNQKAAEKAAAEVSHDGNFKYSERYLEENKPEKEKIAPGKLALVIGGAVLVVAVLIAVILSGMHREKPEATVPSEEASAATEASETIEETTETAETAPATIPANGNPDDETCKGSYTVTDDQIRASAGTVVATMGDKTLTNGQLQMFYWMEVLAFTDQYGPYASSLGLDLTRPLDTQLVMDGSENPRTWQQFFLDLCLDSWQGYQAMALEAEKSGYELPQSIKDQIASLPEQMDNSAANSGLASGEELLQQTVGVGATMDDYVNYLSLFEWGYVYFGEEYDKIQPTDAEVEAYFNENAEGYSESGLTKDTKLVDVRHILIKPEGGTLAEDGYTTNYTDEEWAAGEKAAQALLDSWLAGDKTEESFAALAGEKSQDPGSVGNGGLYERVSQGEMVEAFDDWCFDPVRQVGDYGIVKTPYGFHVMFYSGDAPAWSVTAREDLLKERANEIIPATVERNPAQIDYSAIELGFVDLSK